MVFRKKTEPRCTYCKYASHLDEDTAICIKRGIVSLGAKCHSFTYDPLKRVPVKNIAPNTYESDYTL